MRRTLFHACSVLALPCLLAVGGAVSQARPVRSFLATLTAAPSLSISTTQPPQNEQNPYGVALVPSGFPTGGKLHGGDILVSNFNNAGNLQGTGTTLIAITPSGTPSTFFAAPAGLGPVGLTTALFALRSGLVVVGNTPTTDGTAATVSNGSLIFLDASAKVLLNLSDSALLQGPWDMTADDGDADDPILYVSNVLSGTVTRIDLHVARGPGGPVPVVRSLTQVGSGFLHRTDPNALLVGPTGLLLGHGGHSLYVADTGNNRIQLLRGVRDTRRDLGAGQTVLSGAPLKGPLALAWSPVDTIVASNGDAAGAMATPPNTVVEFDPETHAVVATRQLDTGAPGAVFGIAIGRVNGRTSLLYANDNSVTLDVLPPKP